MKLFVLLFSLMLVSISSLACSCLPNDTLTETEIAKATDVFVAKAIKIDTLKESQELLIHFKVKKSYKGEQGEIITVKTAISSAACGVGVSLDEKWYIFAERSNKGLRINLCGRHTNITRIKCSWFAKNKMIAKSDKEAYKRSKRRVKFEVRLIKQFLKKEGNQ